MSLERFLIALMVCSTLSSSARSEGNPTLRFMTYNVRYASDKQPNAWSDRAPVAVAMLQQYQPDVIGMQEALYPQIKDFAAALPDFGWIGLGRDGGSRDEFMPIFYRTARLEPIEFDHFWLSDTPQLIASATWGNTHRRMVTWVRFRDLRTDVLFYVMNTHFDHRVPLAREKSATLVLQRAMGLSDSPLLLTGDFNAGAERGPVYQTLVNSDGFVDMWTAAGRKGKLLGTFHGFRGLPQDPQRIDWILARGDVSAEYSEIVTFRQGTQFPSDHFPVIADVLLGEAETP